MKLFSLLILFSCVFLTRVKSDDVGARMTPARQARIEHTIDFQRKVLGLPSLAEEKASFEKEHMSHMPKSPKVKKKSSE